MFPRALGNSKQKTLLMDKWTHTVTHRPKIHILMCLYGFLSLILESLEKILPYYTPMTQNSTAKLFEKCRKKWKIKGLCKEKLSFCSHLFNTLGVLFQVRFLEQQVIVKNNVRPTFSKSGLITNIILKSNFEAD